MTNKPFRRFLRKNMTPAEAALWNILKGKKLNGLKFRRQHPIGKYIVDFYCPEYRLIIELDGEAHNQLLADEKDIERENYLKLLNYKIIRFENQDVFINTNAVLDKILSECI